MSTQLNTQETGVNLSNGSKSANESDVFWLAEGGFTGDTEIVTTDGLMELSEVSAGSEVYAFDPATRLVKRKPITEIQSRSHSGDIVALETQRSNLHVAPDHRIPFHTKARPLPRFERAGNLEDRSYYKFISDWNRPTTDRLESVDITRFLDDYEICARTDAHGHTFRAALPDGCEPVRQNSHVGCCFDPETFEQYQSTIEAAADEVKIHAGLNHHRRPYRFDGDDFIRFLGWYITEGSVHWSSSSNTAQVQIAQEDDSNRQSIVSLVDRMGLHGSRNDRRVEFASILFGRLLEDLCGSGCRNKRVPKFVWTLPNDQLQLLLDVLMLGDGNDRQTYYTVSDQLAANMLRLFLELGVKPRYTYRDGVWQIYLWKVNDGFQSEQHVRRLEFDDELYRLAVSDYSVIMAGRNGKFQWVGVSGVA